MKLTYTLNRDDLIDYHYYCALRSKDIKKQLLLYGSSMCIAVVILALNIFPKNYSIPAAIVLTIAVFIIVRTLFRKNVLKRISDQVKGRKIEFHAMSISFEKDIDIENGDSSIHLDYSDVKALQKSHKNYFLFYEKNSVKGNIIVPGRVLVSKEHEFLNLFFDRVNITTV